MTVISGLLLWAVSSMSWRRSSLNLHLLLSVYGTALASCRLDKCSAMELHTSLGFLIFNFAIGPHFVVQTGLEVVVFLSQPPNSFKLFVFLCMQG